MQYTVAKVTEMLCIKTNLYFHVTKIKKIILVLYGKGSCEKKQSYFSISILLPTILSPFYSLCIILSFRIK